MKQTNIKSPGLERNEIKLNPISEIPDTKKHEPEAAAKEKNDPPPKQEEPSPPMKKVEEEKENKQEGKGKKITFLTNNKNKKSPILSKPGIKPTGSIKIGGNAGAKIQIKPGGLRGKPTNMFRDDSDDDNDYPFDDGYK